MAIVALPASPWGLIGVSAGASTFVLNDSDDRVAAIYRAPKAGTIDRILYSPQSKTGTVGVLRLGVQGVSGRAPDGAWLGGGSAYVDLTNPAATAAWQSLGASVSVAKGDLVAAVALTQSGIWDGSNNLSYRTGVSMMPGTCNPPIALSYESSWAEVTVLPCMALRYADGEIITPACPVSALTNIVSGWIAGANPLYRGNRFVPPVACEFRGFSVCVWPDSGGLADFDLHLFGGASFTPLASVAVDVSEWWRVATLTWAVVPADAVTLTAGESYRVAIEPKTATAMQRFMRLNFLDSGTREQMSAGLVASTAPSGGPWSNDDTQMYSIAPLIAAVDDGAGGGGLLVHPGMGGGMRG